MLRSTTQSGMTLVELLIVISIYTVLMVTITFAIQSLYQINSYQLAQSEEVEQARIGLQRFLRDAREMTFAADGTFPLVEVNEHAIGFYSDVDRDNDVEYIRYIISTTTLEKLVYTPTGYPPVYNVSGTPEARFIISDFVQNIVQATSTFQYFNTDGDLIASPSAMIGDIRYVEISLIVNVSPARSPGEFLLRSGVAPRNLKDNQ